MPSRNRGPRKSWWQASARENMLRSNLIYITIEHCQLARLNVHRREQKAYRTVSQLFKGNVLAYSGFERRRVVQARPACQKLSRGKNWLEPARAEEMG